MEGPTHNVFKAATIVGALLAYFLAVALNAVLNIPGISPFNVTIGNVSRKYQTGITPSNATFGIWGLIYIWQLVLVVYGTTLLCRTKAGSYLYVKPGFIPTSFFISYIINLIGNPAWIFVFLEEWQFAALGLLLLGVVTLVVCLAVSCKQLDATGAEMEQKGLVADIWCTRIIVQNGIALYLAWVTCATLINGVVVAVYIYGMSMDIACWWALGILAGVLLSWASLEMYLDRQLRYVFGHYIAYVLALVGIYKEHYDPAVAYTQLELGLLILVSVLAFIKLVVIIVKSITNPIHYVKSKKGMHYSSMK